MPKNLTLAPSSEGRREVPLEVLIRNYGGVAGVSRRIIFRWRGQFNRGQIRGALHRQHPKLIPARHQLDDLIAHLERRKWIRCIGKDKWGKNYVRAPRPA